MNTFKPLLSFLLFASLQAGAANDLPTTVQAIVDIQNEIQLKHIEKETAIHSTNPQANTYFQWTYMNQARESSLLGSLGLSVPSRAEQEARSGVRNDGGPSVSPDQYANQIKQLTQARDAAFADAITEFPIHADELLQLHRQYLSADKYNATSEKSAIALVFKLAFPNAYMNYIRESQKHFPNSQKLAQYKGELRSNQSADYDRQQYIKAADARIKEADDKINAIDDTRESLKRSNQCKGFYGV